MNENKSCPQRLPRKGLPPIPPKMAARPLDARGYPVPWFALQTGKAEWDFRIVGERRFDDAITYSKCWLCGQSVGVNKTYVIGPMCAVNRTTSEPGCHHECAQFAAQACPFLILPKSRRNERNLPDQSYDAPGIAIKRNPGVVCLWTTRSFRFIDAGDESLLLRLGDPTHVEWWAEGKPATRAQVEDSIQSGLPALRAYCDSAAAHRELDAYMIRAEQYYPVIA